jgi:soluble lytic murein transglycosylase-like protein
MTLRQQIERAASAHRLDPDLLHAVVRQESVENPWAIRAEPAYRWIWDVQRNRPFRELSPDERRSPVAPPDFRAVRAPCSRDTEWQAQRTSWGLCQIMGALARELRYEGTYLSEILDPAVNLALGARQLAGLLTRTRSESKALEAYNGGMGSIGSTATVNYAAKVLAERARLRQ